MQNQAAYKTKTTRHYGAANTLGGASIRYRISDATPGYRVSITVRVSKRVFAPGRCSTSFVPQRR